MQFEIAHEQSLEQLLQKLVQRAVARPNIGCAQIWLIDKSDLCSTCLRKPECPNPSHCLHLVAGASIPEDLFESEFFGHVKGALTGAIKERKDDIPLLAKHFVELSVKELRCLKPRLTQAGVTQLQNYDWPGNIRELRNVIERAVILARGGPLHFDLPITDSAPTTPSSKPQRRDKTGPGFFTEGEMLRRERENLLALLPEAGWKIKGPAGAAELLGVKPTTLLSRMKKLELTRPPQSVGVPVQNLLRPARRVFLLLLISFLACLKMSAANEPARVRENFDLSWRFFQGEATNADHATFADRDWKAINLPHDWSIAGPYDKTNSIDARGGFLPTGIGCYRKYFFALARLRGKKSS